MRTILFLAAASLVLSAAAATAADNYAGQKMASQAAVPLETAQKVALNARPGVITDRELEKEAGGSGLRWSFDIKSHGKSFEVGVDAQTGKILENRAEGLHPD